MTDSLMESRIRGNVYVRFGGEHLKTYHSNMERRWVLSLHIEHKGYSHKAYKKGDTIHILIDPLKLDSIVSY